MPETFVIIGAGQAGFQAALTLRQQGFDGRIVMLGDEFHVPYERPPLSKAYLKGELSADRLCFRKPDFFRDREIELRAAAAATGIDREARQVHTKVGDAVGYDKLLIATGAEERTLSLPNGPFENVMTLRTIKDSAAIRKRLVSGARIVVVGGGYIGLEVAAVARGLDVDVTVLEAQDRLMPRVVAPPTSQFFQTLHESHGVKIECDTVVAGVEGDGDARAVLTADGRSYAADLVVVGIGIQPNTELAQAAGLKVDDGILVDQHCRTSDPAIFAAGDCTRFTTVADDLSLRLESVQNAVDQGKTAALAMLDKPAAYDAVPWFWSEQYDVKLQIAGIALPDDETVVRGDPDTGHFSVAHAREGRLAAIETVNALKDFIQGKKLIGSRQPVDMDRLGDPSVLLKDL